MEPVQNVLGINPLAVESTPSERVARVSRCHVVVGDVAVVVHPQAVEVRPSERVPRCRDLVGFHELDVKLDAGTQATIGRLYAKHFAGGNLGVLREPQLASKVDLVAPIEKRCLKAADAGEVNVRSEVELQPRASAHHVASPRRSDSRGVAVVRHLVAATIAELLADFWRQCSVGREPVSRSPVPTVEVGRLRRVERRTHELVNDFRLLGNHRLRRLTTTEDVEKPHLATGSRGFDDRHAEGTKR